MRIIIMSCAIWLGCSSAATAATIKTFMSTGTGFFVNHHGLVVTNLHILKHCERISLHGPVDDIPARLVAQDNEYDLALLKADITGTESVRLRDPALVPTQGEHVWLIGYPGQSLRSGKPITKTAKILSPTGPEGEEKWLQISDVVSQGNSGGPILDKAGNMIGIVQAKAVIYSYRSDDPEHGETSHTGIAISLPIVENFLDRERVYYTRSNAVQTLPTDAMKEYASQFIVNVRCAFRTEVTQ